VLSGYKKMEQVYLPLGAPSIIWICSPWEGLNQTQPLGSDDFLRGDLDTDFVWLQPLCNDKPNLGTAYQQKGDTGLQNRTHWIAQGLGFERT
jgi:hypothetical protein